MVMSAVVRDERWAHSYLGEALVREGLISKWTLFSALAVSRRQGKKLGEFLVDEGLVSSLDVTTFLRRQLTAFLIRHKLLSEDELLLALAVSKVQGKRLNQVLIEERLVSPYALATAISIHFQVPLVDIDQYDVRPEAISLVPADLVFHHGLLPLSVKPDRLNVAMVEPYDLVAIGKLKRHTRRTIMTFAALETQMEEATRHFYAAVPSEKDGYDLTENLVGTY